MSNERKIIYVSTNEDNNQFSIDQDKNNSVAGEGSLRGCIEYALRNHNDKFDIVFKQPPSEGEKGHGIDKMGYWVIRLNDYLPNIYSGDIRINHISPRSVTLTNNNFEKISKLKPENFVERQASSSMLIVGDVRHTGSGSTPAEGSPKLVINGLNFVGHNTQGGHGETGAGGGGAAGASILLIDGNLRLTNTVFNHNKATGGNGGSQAKGGVGFLNSDEDDTSCYWDESQTITNGEAGGSGGVFATPTVRPDNIDGSEGKLSGRPGQPQGGAGGEKGRVYNQIDDDGGAHGKPGKAGGSANSLSQFGHGGGGGGGGGGRGRRRYVSYGGGCDVGRNGAGGAGGAGGPLGGNGVAGGTTTSDGVKKGNRGNGSKGQNGKNIGDAIAVIGGLFDTTNPTLELENVDFYQGNGGDDFLAYAGEEPNVEQFNSKFYSNSADQGEEVKIRALGGESKEIDSTGGGFDSESEENTVPFLAAASSPIDTEIANVRPTTIKARDNISDVIYVDYETADGNIGIYTNLSEPDNPLTKIWRKVVPDKTSEIKQELDTLQNATYIEHLLKGGEPKTTGQKLRDYGIKALQYGCTIKTGMKEKCATGANFLNEAASWYDNQARLQEDAKNRLDQATKEQDDLNDYLLNNQKAEIGTINLSRKRTIVKVENFRLGSDILVLPYAEGRNIIASETSTGDSNNGGVSLGFGEGGEFTPFLEVYFDEETQNANGPVNGFAAIMSNLVGTTTVNKDLEESWAADNNKVSIFGTRFRKPYPILKVKNESYGAASTDLYVDRENGLIKKDLTVEITTSLGNDQIIGSVGPENIEAGHGNDIIIPVLNEEGYDIDKVYANFGEDLVEYVSSKEPLSFVASRKNDFDQVLVKSKDDSGEYTVEQADLYDVEFFHAYGDSTFDLTALKDNPGEVKKGDFVANPKYQIISGSGSTIKGSKFVDEIQISFSEDYNWPSDSTSPDSQAKREWYYKYSEIDGRGGDDVLILNLSGSPVEIAKIRTQETSSLELRYRKTPDNPTKKFLSAKNIEELVITTENGEDLPEGFSRVNINTILKIDNMKGEDIKTGNGDDYIELGKKGSLASGGRGNDLLIGEKGADHLNGNSGFDSLSGGPGRDVLNGGAGKDELTGGKQADIFKMSRGRDNVKDFNLKQGDQVGLLKGVKYEVIDHADGTMIKTDNNKRMLLLDQDYEEFLAVGNEAIKRIAV